QKMLDAEIEEYMKEDKNNNRKNGYSSHKEVRTKNGKIKVDMPRERKSINVKVKPDRNVKVKS
ncbi:MAG: transposase, partial [Bacilli bacterium]